MTQSTTAHQILSLHGWMAGMKREPSICTCDHKLQGTGAVFLYSIGLIYCNECGGYQKIRKPVQ